MYSGRCVGHGSRLLGTLTCVVQAPSASTLSLQPLLVPSYSQKFSRGSVFTDRQSLLFHMFNFHGRVHSRPLCTVQSSSFRDFSIHGQSIVRENREN